MMDLLQRFEEDSLDDPFANPENSDDEGGSDDLERRLAGIDLESASSDKIWAALTPEERARFTSAVRNPSSELAKTLLSSPDLADDTPTPWWVTLSSTPQAKNALVWRVAQPPDIMVLPASLLATPTSSEYPFTPAFPLAYNLVAILVAYAYASRHLSAYPLASCPEARALVSRLVPFLVARDDKTRFPGIESAATDLFSRFDPEAITPAAFALLLRDAATLLRPPLISVAEGDESVVPALRALSDLHALFELRAPRTAAKVVFYAAQVRRVSAPFLRGLAANAERWAAKLEREGGEDGPRSEGEGEVAARKKLMVDKLPEPPLLKDTRVAAPRIVELS